MGKSTHSFHSPVELRDLTITQAFEFRASWRSRRDVKVCLWCQAAPPGVALGLPSLFSRVHAHVLLSGGAPTSRSPVQPRVTLLPQDAHR